MRKYYDLREMIFEVMEWAYKASTSPGINTVFNFVEGKDEETGKFFEMIIDEVKFWVGLLFKKRF